MPCKNELEREARIILQTMLKKKHMIKKLPMGEVALYRQSVDQWVFVKKLPEIIVEHMHKNKWLKLADKIYLHTDKGQNWLAEFIYFLDLTGKPDPQTRSEPLDNVLKQGISLNRTAKVLAKNDDDYAPILKLYNRQRHMQHKYLNDIHVQAGQRLFENFVSSNLQPNVTMNWEKLSSAPQPHYTGAKDAGFGERLYIARKQLYEALKHVGEDFAVILVEVCLFGNGLEASEKSLGWPARSGKLLLTMALDKLAEYFKLDFAQKPNRKYLAWAAHDLEKGFA